MESEVRIRLEDGDDIVVVGVEPLCHLPRFAARGAAGQRGQPAEVIVGWIRCHGVGIEHHRGLEDLVIDEEIVDC